MPLYSIEDNRSKIVKETSFKDQGITERDDLQAMIKRNIRLISNDLLVLDEEFSSWSESSRRIDLLAIDKNANIVVIELKRTADGGHMELQSIRYAAMVSAMTLEQCIDIHQRYLDKENIEGNARELILEFLNWDEENEVDFGNAVRIILVSADFSKEITTSVLWLNQQGLDIQCVRLETYVLNNKVLVNIEQIIPLPETSDFQIEIRKKEQLKKRGNRKFKSPIEILAILKSIYTNETDILEELFEFSQMIGDELVGTTNAFGPKLNQSGKNNYIFYVKEYGAIEMQMKYLSWYQPFSSIELRQELIKKLNTLTDVNISLDKHKGGPKIYFNVLGKDDNLNKFKSIMTWVVNTIQSY